MSAPAPPLSVHGLRKAYRGRVVLRDLDLVVLPGEAVAVVGPNGAGKSTLLGCLTGDRLPDAGEIRLGGVDPFSDPVAAARRLGFVPEEPLLYGELTVGEMLRFVAEARRMAPAQAERETARLLALLSLQGTENVLCRELSQGMGRKVAVIASLLHAPPLLVLDEAFNGLDLSSIAQLTSELDTRRANGAAILLSSHDLGFLARWCSRGLLLAPGGRSVSLAGLDWERWRASPTLQPTS